MNNDHSTLPEVILKIYDTYLGYQEFHYTDPICVSIGRSKQNKIVLNSEDLSISRAQCCLEIEPPYINVYDCGSQGGTYLNGTLIGKRAPDETPEEGKSRGIQVFQVSDGDVLTMGTHNSVRIIVQIKTMSHCPVCHQLLSKDERSAGICTSCMNQRMEMPKQKPPVPPKPQSSKDNKILRLPQPEYGKHYPYGKRLGSGQPGTTVFQIKGTQRAIKILPRKKDYTSMIRFQREAQIGCLLHHPNLVQTYAFGYTITHRPYIIMEACSGMTLIQFRNQYKNQLNESICVDIIQLVLDVLIYMHGINWTLEKEDGTLETIHGGIIHRDIKPSNILIDRIITADGHTEFTVKVADLGIIKPYEMNNDPQVTGNFILGTYEYMPREQEISAQHVTARVDVWSTAAVLFYLLTGEPPRGKTVQNTFTKDARKIRTVNPNISIGLANIIDRALLENTSPERITTAKQFSRLLDQWSLS